MCLYNARPELDYILSPCSFYADGLVKIMASCGMRPALLPPDTRVLPATVEIRRIVIFLPETPAILLNTLQQAAAMLEHSSEPLPMLIVSRSPVSWLWNTLLYQVMDYHQLERVCAASSDLSISSMSILLKNYIQERYPSLKQMAHEEMQLLGKKIGGLTRPELNAILGLLNGCSANTQAKRYGISHKTLYTQRTAGLKKMIKYHPHLASQFPGSQTKKEELVTDVALSAFEREFVHAIHCRQVFPVFQPITDEHLQVRGIEILSRWDRNGSVLLPAAFLPQIRSEYAWLMLTAFVLQEAVKKLNQHEGDFYFSVNIPAAIASNENLIRMMETARQQLHQPQMSARLVMEFAENTDAYCHKAITKNIAMLQKRGFRIMLDDCFSQGSVMFPVRSIRFNSYKLDRSIVNDMSSDPHAAVLIKSLVYYCQQTGSSCIAEGVDSLVKFERLKDLGIEFFQGYYISPPVELDEIDGIIKVLLQSKNQEIQV
ncbi:EAL domain-containing protein [Klebsiella oxytoca]|uniref:EAL domain-containing protein n=1 Tax=Klebsiella oxytoca TaxID=571 RepID=UPI003982987C